jgi:nonsense-mediated mRNA decay protein 3
VLVRKSYEEKRRQRGRRQRAWRLKRLDMEQGAERCAHCFGLVFEGGGQGREADKTQSPSLANTQTPHKHPDPLPPHTTTTTKTTYNASGRNEAAEAADAERFMEELEEDADLRARVNLYRAAPVQAGGDPSAAAGAAAAAAAAAAAQGGGGDGDSDDEGSGGGLPEVPLDELLDDLEAMGLDDGGEEGGGGGYEGGHGGGEDVEME